MLQPGDELPPQSNVLRIAKNSQVMQNPPVEAFKLRKHVDETDLSFGWPEYFTDCPTHYERVGAACTHIARNYSLDREHVLQVDVDRARSLLAATTRLNSVRIAYSPIRDEPASEDNPSHAEAHGIHPLEEPLQQLAAEQLALAVTRKWRWRELLAQGLMPTLYKK
jgi:hypothetical protein